MLQSEENDDNENEGWEEEEEEENVHNSEENEDTKHINTVFFGAIPATSYSLIIKK